MSMNETLNHQRSNAILDCLNVARSIREVGEELDLGYSTVYRLMTTLFENGTIAMVGMNTRREKLFQMGSARPLPQFRNTAGQTFTPNDFVGLFETGAVEFESSKLTNRLPEFFVEIYNRAWQLNLGGETPALDKVVWRKYLEATRGQLSSTMSLISQILASNMLWEDHLLKTIIQDPEALSKEQIDAAMYELANRRTTKESPNGTVPPRS